jgi:hypothetical protein
VTRLAKGQRIERTLFQPVGWLRQIRPGLASSKHRWRRLFTIALLPAVKDKQPWSGLFRVDVAERALIFAFSAVILSFLLASTARELTRLLEGYALWPPSLKARWIETQRRRRKDLQNKVVASELQDQLRYRELLNQYPRKSEDVLPTRLGNALRAGETYGWVQYGLSTVDLWTRLTAVADDKLNEQLRLSRSVLDFFIAMIWLSGALCIATVTVAVWGAALLYLLWLVPLIALMPLWYQRAVAAVSWYAQGMQALVDLTRGRLAEFLGIRLPGNLEGEREIWRAISNYASWGTGWEETPTWIKQIDQATVPRGAKDDGGGS